MKNSPLHIGNVLIQPGERITVALPTPELHTCAPIYIPIHIVHGKKAGPVLLVCGALHGDEVNGVAISQRLLQLRLLKGIRGTLIVIPTMNIYGMITMSRNLPDRRDLDGSFPGSETGSFASRLAHLLTTEIFCHITHCIDLHTGEAHITKFPQVKTAMEDEGAAALAGAFHAPVMMEAPDDHGLLWLLREKQVPTIMYETGEGLRLDPQGIKIGVKGIVRVMRYLDMLPKGGPQEKKSVALCDPLWLRAPSSGLCEIFHQVGTFVTEGSLIAKILDPFGTEQREEIFAPTDGVIIAKNHLPILNEGEPIVEIAALKHAPPKQPFTLPEEEYTFE